MSSLYFSPSASNTEAVALFYGGTLGMSEVKGAHADPSSGPPVVIPGDQVYYWTARWQADESESLGSISRGEAHTFDSDDPNDIVRWLLSDD